MAAFADRAASPISGCSIAGDPTPFIVATLLYAFCVATFGTLIGAAIPNQAAAIQAVALGGFLLVFLLSGLIFPVENIPAGLRWISSIVWGRYYIEIVRDALLQGGGWPAMWFSVLMIGVIGTVFYLLAWRNMRRMQLKAYLANEYKSRNTRFQIGHWQPTGGADPQRIQPDSPRPAAGHFADRAAHAAIAVVRLCARLPRCPILRLGVVDDSQDSREPGTGGHHEREQKLPAWRACTYP